MAERSPYAAIESTLRPLRQAISCVTRSILISPGAILRNNGPIDVVLAGGRPVPLRGPQHIQLRVRLRLRLVHDASSRGSWDAETAAYDYRLSDEDDREILAYHWHPDGPSPVLSPHLHLGAAAEVGHAVLLAAQLPTGQVPIQDVLRLAIESFEVQPQRRDWPAVLGAVTGTPVPPPDR